MRIKATEIVIEDDQGLEVGHIDSDNKFCPDAGMTFSSTDLRFILEAMLGEHEPESSGKKITRTFKGRRKGYIRRTKKVLALVKAIKDNDLRQCDIAKVSGINQGTISSILKGKTRSNDETIEFITLAVDELTQGGESE